MAHPTSLFSDVRVVIFIVDPIGAAI